MADEKQSGGGLNAVDWSWLSGERVASVSSGLDTMTITFESGLVFTVRALLWQGKPFLSFVPFERPR